MKFFTAMVLLRAGAVAALLWLRLHPADWTPFASYGLCGLCFAALAASLTWRLVIRRPAGRSWWRFR